jgi:hypothetical protein
LEQREEKQRLREIARDATALQPFWITAVLATVGTPLFEAVFSRLVMPSFEFLVAVVGRLIGRNGTERED